MIINFEGNPSIGGGKVAIESARLEFIPSVHGGPDNA
jgi:hypothetical protein